MSTTGTPTSVNLPPPSKLRQIIALLAGDTSPIPLAGMTTERQQTALAALATALLINKSTNHTRTRDQLTRDERYMAAVSPVSDVTGGDGPAGLVFAAALLAWAADVVTETTRSDDGHHTPGPAIRHLLGAAQHLLGGYIDALSEPGFELDGKFYVAGTGYAGADEALREMREAADMIQRLVRGSGEQPGPHADA